MQIISLVPSLTEICYALGLGNQLAAVTHACDYPPIAQDVPKITRSLVPEDLTDSAEIDRIVRERVGANQPLFELNVPMLQAVQPDLILTQDLCVICALPADDVRSIAGEMSPSPDVVSIEQTTIDGIFSSIEQIGRLTNRPATGTSVADALRRRIDRIRGHVANQPQRPRIVCLEWLDPLMIAGHWVPEMVEIAGGIDPLGRPGEPAFTTDWETVITAEPDAIVLMPCGYNLEQSRQEAMRLVSSNGSGPVRLDATPAGRHGHIYAVDGSAYFNRPGPRIAGGVEILARILHPEIMRGIGPVRAAEAIAMPASGD